MPQPLRTSLMPGTFVRGNIKDRSVKRGFDKVAFDAKTPFEITESEVDKLFAHASADNPYVSGDSTTATELGDLEMIRKQGAFMLRTKAAQTKFDAKLDALEAKPQTEWTDNDGGIRSKQTAVNKFSIRGRASGFVWCPPNARCIGAPSTISMETDGKRFTIRPKTGERATSLVRRLAAEMNKAGYKTQVSARYGVATVEVVSKPEANGAPTIKNNTTEPIVQMSPQAGGKVRVSIGYGGPMTAKGGKVGLIVDGNTFEVKTKKGESPMPAMDALRAELRKGGYDVAVQAHHGIDTIEQTWTISKADPTTAQFKPGSWNQLSGTIVTHDANHPGPDGGAQRHGAWLQLDKPVMVGDLKVSKLYVGGRDLQAGESVKLNGRLDVLEGPQEIFPAPRYVVLSGMSNVGAGEPAFDGKHFTNAAGKKLPVMSYYPPHITDVPTTIFVVDQGGDKVHEGRSGGFIPQWMNGFHGFRGSAKISEPSFEDSKVRWTLGNQVPTMPDGTKLVKAGEVDNGGFGATAGKRTWWYNPQTRDLYRFSPTIFRGPDRARLDQVAKFD